MEEEMVSFGKYKGRPYTDLVRDTNYYSWLKQQSWFKSKFENKINNIIINIHNPDKDAPTPEHNLLQNKFLDKKLVHNFLSRLLKEKIETNKYTYSEEEFNKEIKKPTIVFEYKFGIDVLVNDIAIEVKPFMGDDYPCVLRKIVSQRERYRSTRKPFSGGIYDWFLIVDQYSGATSWDDLQRIFASQNIRIFSTKIFDDLDEEFFISLKQILVQKEKPITEED
jgi:uncharacterized protein (DUF3820 family)